MVMVFHGKQWRDWQGGWIALGALFLSGVLCASAAERTLEFPTISALLEHARKTQGDPSERVKARGTVTYNHRGYSLFVQDQTGAIYAGCAREQNVALGDEVEVVGRLYRGGFSPILNSASMTRLGRGTLSAAEPMQPDAAVRGAYDMRLISLVGTVGACYDHGSTVILTIVTNGIPFMVELAKERANPFSTLALNSTVRLEGICSVKADRDRTIRSIMILMRSPADLTLLSPPPYWTARRIGAVTLALVGVAAAALMWVVALRRQVGRKTAEIMRLNEQLDQKVKARTTELEVVNRELQAFTYSVSHDLKAPIRAIQNFSGLLGSEHAESMSLTGRQFLNRIQRNADNMGKLISALLSLSHAGQCRLNTETVDMKNLLHGVIDEFSDEVQSRRVEFQIGTLPEIGGDRTLLKQALSNLISNAIKYTRLRDPARIEIGCVAEGAELVFFVKDNGVGFSSKQAEKLFQPFERLHSAREYEGSGIGLAIAHRIITRHGGRMWAEAECEKGSTFYWALPKSQKTVASADTALSRAPLQEPSRV
jgi:signal transduction histidine kinase